MIDDTISRSVPTTSLADQAREVLAESIRNRQLRPGQVLSEANIAKSLGMSRTPIREALAQLEQDGYVTTKPGVGTMVAELTLADVNEICEASDALDSKLAAWAAERAPDHVLEALRSCVEMMVAMAREGDRLNWATADAQFHELLAEASGNSTAAKIARTLRGRLRRLSLSSATRPERLVACTDEHVAVAEAVCDRRPEEATARMHAHLLARKSSIVEMLERHVVPVVGERF